jgi:hypothetical protein
MPRRLQKKRFRSRHRSFLAFKRRLFIGMCFFVDCRQPFPSCVGERFPLGFLSRSAHEARGGKKFMAEGYCVKCKAKREIADGVEEVMKNGRKAIKGKCPTCGTVMFKILGGKAAPAATSAVPTPPPATS